jgi:putative alpha-1,2-mannosidase
MGNEPQFGTPWEYAFAGAPWETQAVVRRILGESFSTLPAGLPGNDDLGATSSWQVWAMLGLYPAIPGVAGFVIGSPVFPKTTVHLAGGDLVIEAPGAKREKPYVQTLILDGKPYARSWLPWPTIARGGRLSFELGPQPNRSWASEVGNRPPSFAPPPR